MTESNLAALIATNKEKYTGDAYLKRVEKPWGYELHFTPEDTPYTVKVLHVNAGKRISLQYHDKKQETQVLIAGNCNLIIDTIEKELAEFAMEPFKGYTNYPGQKHRLHAITDCDVFEGSTPEHGNTVRVQDDYKRGTETEEMRKDPNRGWNSDQN